MRGVFGNIGACRAAEGHNIKIIIEPDDTSIWSEPSTGSKKLGSVSYGDSLLGVSSDGGYNVTMDHNFYQVLYALFPFPVYLTNEGEFFFPIFKKVGQTGKNSPLVHNRGRGVLIRLDGRGELALEAMPDDGVLDMLTVGKVSRTTFFRLVGLYAKGRYRNIPQLVSHYHGQSITYSSLTGDDIVTVVDGEVMRAPAFTVRLSAWAG